MARPAETKARDRALSDDEIRIFWHALPVAFARSKFPKQGTQTQRLLKLCLVTGQRIGECAGITAQEVDFAKGVWTIPAARSKNKHAHEVPLSDLAANLVREILADGTRVSVTYVSKNVGQAQAAFGIPQWSTHDLRRTCVSKMAELGVAPIVLGHVINHRGSTKAGVTLGVYVQHAYAKEKRAALELWANRLAAIVGGTAAGRPHAQRILGRRARLSLTRPHSHRNSQAARLTIRGQHPPTGSRGRLLIPVCLCGSLR